jgi:hypothetical protein
MTPIAAVDGGGTCTGRVAYDAAGQALAFAKRPTMPGDLSRGVLDITIGGLA